jgi:predicted MPP superfamily phosphohydrolase
VRRPVSRPGRAPGPLAAFSSRAGLVRYRIASPRWTAPPLRIAFLSDFHPVAPWTTDRHLAEAMDLARREEPDLVVLGGDFLAGWTIPGRRPSPEETVAVLSTWTAPLGSFAVLGNHDWKDCPRARATRGAENSVIDALAASPLRLLRNQAVPLGTTGAWLAGFDSQQPWGRSKPGYHDPDAAFAPTPAGAPTILAAHEPDWFAAGDPRAVLQLSGHTHGGQANLAGWRPLTPSRYGGRYAWGHHVDGDRHLIVSGGIGFSGVPMRLAAPPEVTLVDIAGA